MIFPFVFVLIAAVFFIQLLLCGKSKRLWVKLIPTALIALGELACVAGYAVSVHMEQAGEDIYGAAFAALIYGFLLLFLLAADAAAWAVSAIVRFAQKRKNNL